MFRGIIVDRKMPQAKQSHVNKTRSSTNRPDVIVYFIRNQMSTYKL